jgi:hypothetical protein
MDEVLYERRGAGNLAEGLPVLETELRFMKVELELAVLKLTRSVDRRDPRGNSGWLGVVLLLLGIVFSGNTDLLGIGAPT